YLSGILHDIGSFIDARKHHKHSYYVIRNSQIPGISEKETDIIAAVARYHRKAPPRSSHPEYMNLDRNSKVVVATLAAILRVADALDHSHQFKFKNADFRIDGHQLIISCRQQVDCSIERIFLEFKGSMFYRVMDLKAVIA
ncbi:MAG: HD domain-containing protein, partial [Victivallales bacterium]|nr:HD domain-containing protein [Victivallales bacterium]